MRLKDILFILEKGVNLNESSVESANKLLKKYNKKYNFHRLADMSTKELKQELGRV
jgi:hypothetical protein